jgi:predicted amidohydrolase
MLGLLGWWEFQVMKRLSTFFSLLILQLVPQGVAGESADESARSRFVRIGHYQCVCQQGNFVANLKKVTEGLELAAQAKLDIVSFPESFLTGYFPTEADARGNSFAIDSPEMRRVLEQTGRFPSLFMVGFNELRDGRLRNTVAVIDRGKLLGRYSKAMPIYGYFEPGREFPVFEKKGLKFGVVICADGGYIEPTRILALKGAQLIFAPHFNFVSGPVRHYQMVRNDHIARAVENGVYFLRANNVVPGRQLEGSPHDGYGYGDSYLLNPNGEVVAAAGLYHEYLMVYNFDLEKQHRSVLNRRSRKSANELLDILQNVLDVLDSEQE